MRLTVFTLLAVLAAFLLFGLPESVRSAFEVAGQSVAGVDRLITVSKIGFIESLPKKLLPRIAAVPGVARVSYANWFGGIYREPKNFFASEAIPDSFLDFHPEWRLSPDQRRAFHNIRTGAIVGEALARKFNWKLGDRIPLLASGLPQKNGSNTWTFNLVGIYRVTDPNLKSQENALYFNWDYFDLARQVGNDSVGWFLLEVADRRQAQRVAQEIDALSANSDHETKTQSEQAFNATLLGQFADIGLIVGPLIGAVFFTLVILIGNTMAYRQTMRMPDRLGHRLGAVAAVVILVALLIELPWWLLVTVPIFVVPWMGLTRVGQQTWSLTQVGIATIPQRLGSSSVVVVGIAGVVGVLVALLGMGAGFEATLKQTGTDDTAIIIRGGAQAEINSVVDHLSATVVSQAPQVLGSDRGQPIASPELVVVASLPKKSSGLDTNVEIRGVGERVWELRPNIKVIAGRKLIWGMREVMVGKGAREQFSGLEPGSTVRLNGQSWTVVGAFDARDAHNSEIWGDTAVVGSAYRRGSSTNSITVRLRDAAAFDAFKASLASDPRLKVEVKTTRDYYSQQSESLTHLIRIVGVTVGVIMAIGATFGALNTMYAAVAMRPREIATLRAMGFQGVPVIGSVLLETMLLAVLGGAIGAAVAWAIFDNFTASTLGENFSQVVFAFKISPALLWSGLKWALAIGFIGGLFPALRAASTPVAAGLREL